MTLHPLSILRDIFGFIGLFLAAPLVAIYFLSIGSEGRASFIQEFMKLDV